MKYTIFKDVTADGNYPSAGTSELNSRKNLIAVIGTFDGAAVAIEISVDNVNWSAVRDEAGVDVSITVETQDTFMQFLPLNYSVRGVISSAGASTDLTMYISG